VALTLRIGPRGLTHTYSTNMEIIRILFFPYVSDTGTATAYFAVVVIYDHKIFITSDLGGTIFFLVKWLMKMV